MYHRRRADIRCWEPVCRILQSKRFAEGPENYRLETVLILILLAKLCGEDKPSGIAKCAKHRLAWLCDALKLERKEMPHRRSCERILEKVVSWEELEQLVSRMLSGKHYFGKQVVVAIDGKVLLGTLDEKQEGVYLLSAYTSLTREDVSPQELLQMTRSYWGIENGLHYRRDVTLHEDHTRMTRKNAARVIACLNNLVLGLLIGKFKYRYLTSTRRFFAVHPDQALATLQTRLEASAAHSSRKGDLWLRKYI